MRTLSTLLAIAVVGGVIAAAGYGLYTSGGSVWSALHVLEPAARTALLFGAGTLLLAALVLVLGIRSAAIRLSRSEADAQRLALYRATLSEDAGLIADLDANLALLASPEVLEAHDTLRRSLARGEDASPARTLLIRAMRRDLGLRRAGPGVNEVSRIARPATASGTAGTGGLAAGQDRTV